LDDSILKYNKQNSTIFVGIPRGEDLINDTNAMLGIQSTKDGTLGKILRDAAWVIDEERYPEEALYQI
jgi:hypothetical protein